VEVKVEETVEAEAAAETAPVKGEAPAKKPT
jgi:hypothetical protein